MGHAATLTAFRLYFPNSNPTLPPFLPLPIPLFLSLGYKSAPSNPPSRYIPFASRMERQFRHFPFPVFLQIMAPESGGEVGKI